MKLTISIGPKPTLLEKVSSAVTMFSFILLIPTYNHFILSGGWALDLCGALFGLLATMVLLNRVAGRDRNFETKEAAIDWLNSDEWKPNA